MANSNIGFAVIYRWRVRPGFEDQFQQAWATTTKMIMADRNGLGSRLHRDSEGLWVAYAQWPTRQAWEESSKEGPADLEVSKKMRESIDESFEPMLLEPISDYLKPAPS